jgi:hypothetical protein
MSAAQKATEPQRLPARKAMDAAYEAELVMALAADRPDADDPPPPGHPGARRRGAGSPVPGTSEFLPDEVIALVLPALLPQAAGLSSGRLRTRVIAAAVSTGPQLTAAARPSVCRPRWPVTSPLPLRTGSSGARSGPDGVRRPARRRRRAGPGGHAGGDVVPRGGAPVNESIHLGSTLYGRRWWGTTVNPDAKLLLLSHCFDDCGYGRVKIQTDLLDVRSQAAIAKLGAQREGVVRRDMKREDGSFRDSVVFSVLIDEWPAVKAGLEARLRG